MNTAPKEYFEIILVKNQTSFKTLKVKGGFNQAEKLLPSIDRLLKREKIKPAKLQGIGVVIGPGGFTSVRIGVAVANAFGYGLNLPVAGVKVDEFQTDQQLVNLIIKKIKVLPKAKIVLPFYDREPNITMAKK